MLQCVKKCHYKKFRFDRMSTSFNDINFDFQNSAIIKPPIISENAKKHIYLVIDSRDRNTDFFPNPSKYTIVLDNPITDVVSAELVVCHVPFMMYMINKNNNYFFVNVKGIEYTLHLDYGNYSSYNLAQHIESKFSEITSNTYQFSVQYDEIKDKYRFYCSESFSFNFLGESSTAKILGFKNKSYSSVSSSNPPYSSLTQEISAEYRKNFTDINYALLDITSFNSLQSFNQIIEKSFAVIPSAKKKQNVNSNYDNYKKNFNPILKSLEKLYISFKDRKGEEIDFQNHDHYLMLKLEVLKQPMKYNI